MAQRLTGKGSTGEHNRVADVAGEQDRALDTVDAPQAGAANP